MAKIKSTEADTPKDIPSVTDSKTLENPSMGIQDLVALLNLIDIASRRGAYHANEMSAVGAVYDKVFGFLKATGAINTDKSSEEASENKE